MAYLNKHPKFWFYLTIGLFVIELAYLIPMFLLILYANLCCEGYDAGIGATSMIFAISSPPVLIIEAVVFLIGPVVAGVSFFKNQDSPKIKTFSGIVAIQFILFLPAALLFLIF